MARGFEGVKADLSELGQQILGLAWLFRPLFGALAGNDDEAPPLPTHEEGPNPSPCPNLRAAALRGRSEGGGNGGGGGGVREEIVQFIRELIASPESWLDFPVMTNTEFEMSDIEREHVALVERLVPDLPALRESLCPALMPESAFWTMYFARVHPKLDRRQSKILSTHKPGEEMQDRHNPEPQPAVAESSFSVMKEKSGDSEREADQPQVRPTSAEATEATTSQYLDDWFDTPAVLRETDASTATRQQLSSRDDDSYSELVEGGNVVLLKRNRFSRSIEAVDQDYSLISSREWLRLSQSDHEQSLGKLPDKVFTCDESDWHADEDNLGYEFV